MKRFFTRALLCTSSIAACSTALAQSTVLPPPYYTLDRNSVDLATGAFVYNRTDISIGSGDGALSYSHIMNSKAGSFDPTTYQLQVVGTNATITLNGVVDQLTSDTTNYWTSNYGTGAQLSSDGQFHYIYTMGDGTKIAFAGVASGVTPYSSAPVKYYAGTITKPTGEVTGYSYVTQSFTVCRNPGCTPGGPGSQNWYASRVSAISSNRGYALKLDYAADSYTFQNAPAWTTVIGVTAVNQLQVSGCNLYGTATCSTLAGTRSVQYTPTTITDPLGNKTTYGFSGYDITSIQLPLSSSPDVGVTYDGYGRVKTFARPAGTSTYTWTTNGSNQVIGVTITDPNPSVSSRVVVVDPVTGKVTSDTNQGRTFTYTNDAQGRVKSVKAPEGNSTTYTYDARGNVLSTVTTGKTGGTITTSASFDASCANPLKCNKPNSTTDARSNVTSYGYDPTYGVVTGITPPADAAPIGFTYVNQPAPGGGMILVPQTQSQGGTTTTYAYPGSGDPQPSSVTVGGGGVTATQSFTYTSDGDVKTVSGPVAGMVTTNIYDALRRVIGVVGPGANPATGNYPATNLIYDGNGRLQTQQQGTSDSAGTTFTALATSAYGYDPVTGRLSSTTVSGTATASTTSYGYDAADRPTTTTLLMQNQGANRTTTNAYDANGLLSTVTTASSTADASTITYGYSGNGKVASIQDGNGNITRYAYDGFDRPQTTTYADNSTEVLGYDNNANVLTDKRRDGQTISYTYDTVNRVKSRSGTGIANSYGYDAMGNLNSATGGSYNVSRTYDALGHMLTDTTGGFAMLNDFDAAGRRTGEHWAATGGYIRFQYAPTGAMSAITDANGSSWVAFTNDDLGRRTNLGYLNGRSTSYGYGSDLRLASLTHHMAGGPGTGTQNDVGYGFGYNPAGQITSRSTSNDSYVFSAVPRDASVTPNVLNQPSPSASFAYDARGNQIATAAAPARASSFRIDDKPLSVGVSGRSPDILGYDALDRLASIQVGSGGPVTRLVWDGNELAGELDAGGNLQGFYARGPGSDEPMVWWTPSGIHVFHADERGSIVALSNSSGQVERIHSYDAYGREGAAAHLGRFGYTGAIALPDSGLVHMRARAYDPALGRFVSADPIGVAGGINLYGYAGGDPVNLIDPSGLQGCSETDATSSWEEQTAAGVPRCADLFFGGLPGGAFPIHPCEPYPDCVTVTGHTIPGGISVGGPGSQNGTPGNLLTGGVPAPPPPPTKPAPPPKQKRKLDCPTLVDLGAAALLITGGKTGAGAVPEALEATEFIRGLKLLNGLKAGLVGSGAGVVALAGSSIVYYHYRKDIKSVGTEKSDKPKTLIC